MPIRPFYKEAVHYLYSLEKYGMKLGFARIMPLLKSLGNPQNKLNIIHIGGTNGKGSTSAMVESILYQAGYKVGLYTSPHLVRFNERIRLNEKDITDGKIAKLVERIEKGSRVKGQGSSNKNPIPTFFEFATAMAFLYFAEEEVDFAIMEVGLGGRLDATNVCSPMVSIITNVAKDHEAILGRSIKDIAFEKAGIIKRGGRLISAETKPAALKVLTEECKKNKAMFYRLDKDFFIDENTRVKGQGLRVKKENHFAFKGRRWFLSNLTLNLLGRHQQKNAACALAALEVLEETCPRMSLSGKDFLIPKSAVRKGLQNVSWPGRLEIIHKGQGSRVKGQTIILDCAHNPAGADVLREALMDLRITNYELRNAALPRVPSGRGNEFVGDKPQRYSLNRKSKIILVLGIMADKDIKGIFSKLAPLAHTVILTRPKTERAASLDVLYREINKGQGSRGKGQGKNILLIEDVADACRTAMSMGKADDMICITGSTFTVAEAKVFLAAKMRKRRR